MWMPMQGIKKAKTSKVNKQNNLGRAHKHFSVHFLAFPAGRTFLIRHFVEHVRHQEEFLFLFLNINLGVVPENSTPGKFPNSWFNPNSF